MNTAKTRAKAPRRLINHRRVADLFGVSARTWRRWVTSGTVPLPHQHLGTLMLYDLDVINERLESGLWPPGVEFRKHTVEATQKGE